MTVINRIVAEHQPWDRRAGETMRAYLAFRSYRDVGPGRRLDDIAGRRATIHAWSARWQWVDRAEAWDDECHRIEDRERLQTIRQMHSNHQRAGRAAMHKGLEALAALPVNHVPAGAAVRLLELGARLERATLLVSVEELQGVQVEVEPEVDPWERFARELQADGI